MEVGCYDSARAAAEHGLVILALGRPYWLDDLDGRHRLLVQPDVAAEARRQLALFDGEASHWPPHAAVLPHSDVASPIGALSAFVWAALILIIFRAETRHPEWLEFGAVEPRAIYTDGEWWRPITALFLHADAAHVLSNAISGFFVITAMLAGFGVARGWIALAASAILGNAAAAAISLNHAYRSVGASTAVFAALGLLTGRAVHAMSSMPGRHRWRAMFVPLGAGVTLLALYGAGGVRVDVIAHVSGFVTGTVTGALFAGRSASTPPRDT